MKHKVTIRVPVEKRGFFGRKKIVYEERTVVVDGTTYRRIKQAKEDAEFEDFLDFIEELEFFEEMEEDL